jgi:hypothetical protein
MIPCYVKHSDVDATTNEIAVLQAVLTRCGPVVLPCFRVHGTLDTIGLIEYPINLSNALRFGHVDPCGSVVHQIIDRVRAICSMYYDAGIVHYDLHTSNVVVKWLGTDLTCVPDVRFIDSVLSKDYASTRHVPNVRVMEKPDAKYDWFFFCYSLMQSYILSGMPLPVQILAQQEEIVEYKNRMDAAGHEWSRVTAPPIKNS